MPKKEEQNLNAFILRKGPSGFLIEAKKNPTLIQTKITIDFDGRINEYNWEERINFVKQGESQTYSAFLGIINILFDNFLLFVDQVIPICTILNLQVYECKSFSFIPIQILSFGHYFSFEYPLTMSLQKLDLERSKDRNIAIETLDQVPFFWNRSMMAPLIHQGISAQWHIQLIQGFVSSFTSKINDGLTLKYSLISRRSIYRSGTRCNHRGADTEGHTANFVEHESIYEWNNGQRVSSHIQIRGSLPILWEQNGIKGSIKLAGGQQLSLQAFRKHFKIITEIYGQIFSISLMAEGRKGEKLLTSTFKQHYDQAEEIHPQVSFDVFDIKEQCKGGKYQNINPYILLPQNVQVQQNQGYYLRRISNSNSSLIFSQIERTQIGVIRTNCKSSLDRTNIFQTKIEMNKFSQMLNDLFGLNFQKQFSFEAVQMMEQSKSQIEFIKQFKLLWSQNGDHISMHYAGTNALTSHATKTGQTGFYGKLRGRLSSIKRLYAGTFQDSHKQEASDIILGNHLYSNKKIKIEEELKEEEKKRFQQFIKVKQISVFLNSWSLTKNSPKVFLDHLHFCFDFQGLPSPDIMVLCFQDISDQKFEVFEQISETITNESILPKQKVDCTWINSIQASLIKAGIVDSYEEADLHRSGGVLTCILAKNNIVKQITAVEHDGLTWGTDGKGSVIIKFKIGSTKLCFINAHLVGSPRKSEERVQQIKEIEEKAFQQSGMSKYRREKIDRSHKIFLCGNLNFRVQQPFLQSQSMLKQIITLKNSRSSEEQNVKEYEKEKQFEQLIKTYHSFDQLKVALEPLGILSHYKEGSISFLPTYNYFQNSNSFDHHKEHPSSWCDRILMWNNQKDELDHKKMVDIVENINHSKSIKHNLMNEEKDKEIQIEDLPMNEDLPLFYNRSEVNVSCHRPVKAFYTVNVKYEDEEMKSQVFKEIISQRMESMRISKNLFEYQLFHESGEKNPEIEKSNDTEEEEDDDCDDEDDDEQGKVQAEYDEEYTESQDIFANDQNIFQKKSPKSTEQGFRGQLTVDGVDPILTINTETKFKISIEESQVESFLPPLRKVKSEAINHLNKNENAIHKQQGMKVNLKLLAERHHRNPLLPKQAKQIMPFHLDISSFFSNDISQNYYNDFNQLIEEEKKEFPLISKYIDHDILLIRLAEITLKTEHFNFPDNFQTSNKQS